MNPTERFTPHADNYVKYRPSYPPAALDFLLQSCKLDQTSVVADIGAGTGKFTACLLERGLRVFAVEPNAAMRAEAEKAFAGNSNFTSVAAPAEATTLPDHSVNAITVAQAFHWLDRDACKQEFHRILIPGGRVAIVWNRRDVSYPFVAAYEEILQTYRADMPTNTMTTIREIDYAGFFASYQTFACHNSQQFDYEGLVGRILSASYAPMPGHPKHEAMRAALRALFDEYQQDGLVTFDYKSEVIAGDL